MGLHYRKSVKIGSNSRINVSKSGLGVSTGTKGARYSVGPSGTRTTVGAPGTGLSYESRSSGLSGGCLSAIVTVVLIILIGGFAVIFYRVNTAGSKKAEAAPTATHVTDSTTALRDALLDYLACDRVELHDRLPLPKYNVDIEYDLSFTCDEETAVEIMVNALNKIRGSADFDDVELALVTIYDSALTRYRSGYIPLRSGESDIAAADLKLDIQK